MPGESTQRRVRTNMHNILSKKFMALVQEYQALQNNYKEKCRERVQRQAEIVRPGISREEVDEMISSGGDAFTSQMISSGRHMEAKNALMSMQEQQRDLLQLERSIQELHQVFLDMASLIDSGNDGVDAIETSSRLTTVSAAKAAKHVSRAEEYIMQRRRRVALMVTAISTVLIIAGTIVGLIIAYKFGAFSSIGLAPKNGYGI